MTQDKMSRFSAEDAEMEATIREAKHSFGQFLETFMHPNEDLRLS